MIKNPILPGFNPDPSILRIKEDYYIATSTFEWFPGIALYHSRNLKDWELIGHALDRETQLNLSRLPSAKGVWAPSLTFNQTEGLFYLAYTLMYSHNARYFDLDNFLVTSPTIEGPWSDPIYLHSIGFDPSCFHDDDDRTYVVCLQWELRNGEGHPDCIVIQEYDKSLKKLVGPLQEIWRGGTNRGCIEGPRLYKRNGFYYLLCAEGGTGYGHCVTVGRASSPWGPYEGDRGNPILSASSDFSEMDNDWYLKTHQYNPSSPLQKTGHASLVQTPSNSWYIAYLCARPFVPELRCTLGRETALQEVFWTEDDWLRLRKAGTYPSLELPPPKTIQIPLHNPIPSCGKEQFDGPWNIHFITPRREKTIFSTTNTREGYLRLFGQQSLCSLDTVAFVARRLQTIQAKVSTHLEFNPKDWRESAGLVIYHDNMNYRFFRITYDQEKGQPILMLTALVNGKRKEIFCETLPKDTSIRLGMIINNRKLSFVWELDDGHALSEEMYSNTVPEVFDLSELSDEFSTFGEFTGTFVGMACEDFSSHCAFADFSWFDYHHTAEKESFTL
jgi:xylan 1,4-beta-xylosidase